MKVSIIQVPYPQPGKAVECLQWQMDLLNNIEAGSTDLIIFPENANCTGYTDKGNMIELINNQGAEFVEVLKESAKRINCSIFSVSLSLTTCTGSPVPSSAQSSEK